MMGCVHVLRGFGVVSSDGKICPRIGAAGAGATGGHPVGSWINGLWDEEGQAQDPRVSFSIYPSIHPFLKL
jgi:hypothetical protein